MLCDGQSWSLVLQHVAGMVFVASSVVVYIFLCVFWELSIVGCCVVGLWVVVFCIGGVQRAACGVRRVARVVCR